MDLHDEDRGLTDSLCTARLVLRRLRGDDRADVMRIAGRLEVSRWLAVVPHPYRDTDFDDFLGLGDPHLWVIERDGTLIGAISGGESLGYWLDPDAWGQGLMVEAGEAVLTRGFAEGRDEVDSTYHVGNDASRRVLEKLGFTDAGAATSTCAALGLDEVPARRMVLTKATWEAGRV